MCIHKDNEKGKDIHIFLLQRGVTRAAGMSRVGRSGLGLGETRRTRPSRWEIRDMVTLVMMMMMMGRLVYAQALKWEMVANMGRIEDDEEEGRMLREQPDYALTNHHYTHVDDQRADPRRLHHRHPSPFLDNLP